MENLRLLDCTLRDGGYINDWKFGKRTIKNILYNLMQAKTDIIEVGFLRDCVYDEEKTLFNSIQEAKKILPQNHGESKFSIMALHDKYDINKLEDNDGTIEYIRVTFHNYDIDEGLEFCKKVILKGYKLFINPINLMGYSDQDLLLLIEKINAVHPYGFSIVDTFGSMTKNDLVRIYSLCEKHLDKEIVLGLHLHENMSMAFSLAQTFLEMRTMTRDCVIDASLYGMGRVPGNLCIELLMDYMNKQYNKSFQINYALDAIEEHIVPIKEIHPWGYMTEYFLSAKYNLHRNYAEYLLKKGKLTIKDINQILCQIEEEKKAAFDEKYVEKLYIIYQNHKVDDEKDFFELKKAFKGKKVIVLAPGNSLQNNWETIIRVAREKEALLVSANFYHDKQNTGYAFFSNSRRFETYKDKHGIKNIITSNIDGKEDVDYTLNYYRLALNEEKFSDNCGIMLLRMLQMLEVEELNLAGFDGFSGTENDYLSGYFGNYSKGKMENNSIISKEIKIIGKDIKVNFLTDSVYCK